MNGEVLSEVPLPISEHDALVPASDLEIPPHVELERVEEVIDLTDEVFIAGAHARLEQAALENEQVSGVEAPERIGAKAVVSATEAKQFTPKERTELEKKQLREDILAISAALARERRKHLSLSLAVVFPPQRPRY